MKERLWLLGATTTIAVALAMPAIAQTDDPARSPSDIEASQAGPVGGEFKLVSGLGPARLTEEGLLEVLLPDGTVLTTHGSDPDPVGEPGSPAAVDEESLGVLDQLSDAAESVDAAQADDAYVAATVGRDPICVGPDAPHLRVLYTFARDDSNQRDRSVPVIRAAVRAMNKRIFEAGQDYSNGNIKVDYKAHCFDGGAVSVGDYRSQSTSTTEDGFSAIVGDARAAGYTDPDAKYLIFYDDPKRNRCGTGQIYSDDTRSVQNLNNNVQGAMYAVVYGRACWKNDRTPLHESTHNMGGVQNSAPRSTGSYHCTDEYDVMCYDDDGPTSRITFECGVERYDCHHNDYFDTGSASGYLQSHWNIGWAGNKFLAIR